MTSAEALLDREAASSAATPEHDLPELIIEARTGWVGIDWAEIWRYRELLYFLTWRDVKIRYKQTALGAAWAIIQPLANMVVFTFIFGKLAGLDKKTGGIPYPLFVYTAQLAWTFFANAVTTSSNSLVGSSNLISKVYFPRLIIPFAALGVGLVDLAVSAGVLLGLMAFYRVMPTAQILLMPVFLLGGLFAAAGVGTLLSALTVSYRDFRYVVNFLMQFWMYVTPVMYPGTLLPARWRTLTFLNPMTGVVEGFRTAFLGQPLNVPGTCISLGMAVVFTVVGAWYFRAVERRFADVI